MEAQEINGDIAELEQCFLEFARRIFYHLRREFSDESMPPRSNPYLTYHFGENSYRWGFTWNPQYATYLQEKIQYFLTLEETQQCVQKHAQVNLLLPSLRGSESSKTSENVTQQAVLSQKLKRQVILDLLVPLNETYEEYETLRPTDERLLAQYRRCIALWSDPFDHVDITFPLMNFSCDASEPQPVSTHLFLAPLTPADKTALWNDDAKISARHSNFNEVNITYSAPLAAHTLMSLSWKLSGTYSFRKNDTSDQNTTKQEVLRELGDVVTALRLLKQGNIGTSAIYEKNHTPVLQQKAYIGNVLVHQQALQSPALSQYYKLSKQEIPVLKELVEALHQLHRRQANASLYGDRAVALRRFNQSYSRELPEDQIIDLTIALEGSLLAELRDELSYRLSLRGSALLALAGKWEPSKSQILLKAMYDIRSNIVHNGRLLSDLEKDIRKLQRIGIQPHEFPQRCEDIVRDVLKEYVLRGATGQSLKQINDELDESIVESLKSRPHPGGQETNE